jgi:hypothetical protein
MSDIPKFTLYGEGDTAKGQSIQPELTLREWGNLNTSEKQIALKQVENSGWLTNRDELVQTIGYLNEEFLRTLPGKNLHQASRDPTRMAIAALQDFCEIFVNEKNDTLVMRMLSKFVERHIDYQELGWAKTATDEMRPEYLRKAFWRLDRLANCFNHIFEQFAVNQLVTRTGFVPQQDEKIVEQLYKPTLAILADPKWTTVSADLSEMFVDYREQRYPEVITKAHSAVQRFLQILVGDEGKSGKGELAKLVSEAKHRDIIPTNRFVDPVVAAILSYIPSERAINSTAKPAVKETTPAEAMLMMNVVMILLQFCLQNMK